MKLNCEKVIQFDCGLGLILNVLVSFLSPTKIPRHSSVTVDPFFRCRNQSHSSHWIIDKTSHLVHPPSSRNIHITNLRLVSDYLLKKKKISGDGGKEIIFEIWTSEL